MIIKDYYEKLCTNKLNNLKEGEKFLDEYYLPVLNYESQKYLDRPMMNKKAMLVAISHQSEGQDKIALQLNSTKHLKNR